MPPLPQTRGQNTIEARPYTMVKQTSNSSGNVAHMSSDCQATSNAEDSGMAHVSDIVESLMLEENPSTTSMNCTVEGHGTFQAMLSEETCKKLIMILRTPEETDLRPRDFAVWARGWAKGVASPPRGPRCATADGRERNLAAHHKLPGAKSVARSSVNHLQI